MSAEIEAGGSAVEVADLSISYADGDRLVPVLKHVGFRLEPGQAIGLVGESGSGKSTLARALLGSLRQGSQVVGGTVTIGARDVLALRGEALRSFRGGEVGLVAQNAGHALTPSMRTGAQIAEMLRAHGRDASATAVHELASLVHLKDTALLERYPHELSGGQQQRIGIALGLAAEPDVLVLDEPTTALDVVTQRAILDLVAELRERLGLAVVVVSHDLGVIAELADQVLVLRSGEAVEQGPVAQVLGSPEHPYTAELLAAAPRLQESWAGAAASSSPAPVLEIRGLAVRYRPRDPLAVDGLDLTVPSGRTVAIVGESGSGKSTVAQALAGLVTAERGQITFTAPDGEGGADLLLPAARRSRSVLRGVQMVFQNADLALNPRRTVGDAIARPLTLFRRTRSRAEANERVAALLEEVGLDPSFARRLPGQLSGGQRQRIGIARALAAEPTLLIADEITTALDVSVQAEVLDLLSALQESRGLSCLFISHDLAVVQRVADHIAVMRRGRIVEQGAADQVLFDPRHDYTRELLAATLDLDAPAS